MISNNKLTELTFQELKMLRKLFSCERAEMGIIFEYDTITPERYTELTKYIDAIDEAFELKFKQYFTENE